MSGQHPPGETAPASPPAAFGWKKLWAFRILACVGVPLLLAGILEAGLRIAGVGYPTTALIERDWQGTPTCFPNAEFSWRFFPRHLARDFEPGLTFPKAKPPGSFRIFVLGGSAARGTPDQMFSFGRLLEVMLAKMYPEIRFEVFNAAMTAINSHVVLEIARDCAAYEPDLFIVYLGNNEVVGPFGPGTVFTAATPSLPLIRATIAAKTTRVGQLCDALATSLASRGRPGRQWAGLAMFREKQVRAGSPPLESVYQHLERNLDDIYRVAHRAGAAVIVSDIGVNLRDCPPFGSLNRDDLSEADRRRWDDLMRQGVELEAAGSFADAVDRYAAAAALDDTHAELQFRLGRCRWEMGDHQDAKRHYQRAVDQDTLRVRADSRINAILRESARGRAAEGVVWADGVEAMEGHSRHQTPGRELFHEHVHLTFTGNYVLATAILPHVQSLLPAGAEPRAEPPGESEVRRRVAYTPFDEWRDRHTIARDYVMKPPFTGQAYHAAALRELENEVGRLRARVDPQDCLEDYTRAIAEHPADWRLLVKHYELLHELSGDSNLPQQESLARRIVAVHPYDRGYQLLGNLLLLQGRFDEAEAALQTSLFMNPIWAESHYSLAVLALKRDDRAGAIRHLRRELAVAPARSVIAYRLLATQYDQTGELAAAIETLSRALAIFPENETVLVRCQLGEFLNKQGRVAEAGEQLDKALQLDPSLAEVEAFRHQYELIKGARPTSHR
jgi:tetratricopeptide (TPR) repeat protein